MFSFHKPRVYRSIEGCCICRAKSSSSRFTDSRKYEEDSIKCFDLKNARQGEICNACVLLVKRYKRLPAGSQRNWGHVVDARAGPGTKTLTKFKRIKEENICDKNTTHGKSVITEKFSKIFKKSKRAKTLMPNKSPNHVSLAKKSELTDSDNEDSKDSTLGFGNNTTNTSSTHSIVLFQTQTRASAFRTRNMKHTNKIVSLSSRKIPTKLAGSRRRKKRLPKKLSDTFDDDKAEFYDETEWKKRMTCCGVIYECAKLGDAIIVDVNNYKVCPEHQHQNLKYLEEEKERQNEVPEIGCLQSTIQKCVIKATLPAVVKLSLPTISSGNITKLCNKPTPVLKKHHLFFKRQSELFPNGETSFNCNKNPMLTETETEMSTVKTETENLMEKSQDNVKSTNLNLNSCIGAVNFENSLPRHSIAKKPTITTTIPIIKPVLLETTKISTFNVKSTNFLHRIKSDAGKIVKHSIDKINAAVRLKPNDLQEIKHMVKPVDKNFILSSKTTGNLKVSPNTVIKITNATSTVDDLSPTSTTTSANKFSDNSSDSGFDENVIDRKSVSPLQQENDTKNLARPHVQTLILASGIKVHGQQQNLVYAGNETAAKILQQRMQQKQSAILLNGKTLLQSNKCLNIQPNSIDQPTTATTTSSTVKLMQAKNNNSVISIGAYGLSNIKMRAVYNNNSIQHENGVTTIIPASSLAATNQTVAMQTSAPNTITITPATIAQKRPIANQISFK